MLAVDHGFKKLTPYPLAPFRLSAEQRAGIDGLRGFLALWVFYFHFAESRAEGFAHAPYLQNFLKQGPLAVPIFFFVSGFLVAISFSNLRTSGHSHAVIRFFIRRTFRIWPAWLCALTAVALLNNYLFSVRVPLTEFLWNLFLLFGFQPYSWNQLIVFQSWSLFPEEIFYLCFPLLGFLFENDGFLPLLLISFLTASIWTAKLSPVLVPIGCQWDTPLSTFAVFLSGTAFYWLVPRLPRVGSRVLTVLSDLTVVSFIAVLAGGTQLFLDQWLAASLLLCALIPGGVLHWVFAHPLRGLGKRCFSIYLTHGLALTITGKVWFARQLDDFFEPVGLNLGLQILFATALTLIFSEILFRLIERPFYHLGKRLSEFNLEATTISN